jgi:hypothetical protein
MPDESKWYYGKAGKSFGPYSEHDLCQQYKAGAFTADDFVYCKGHTDGWVKASTIAGLCDSLALDAEPEPERHQVPLYERASFEQAKGPAQVKKEQTDRDKKFWDRLRPPKK